MTRNQFTKQLKKLDKSITFIARYISNRTKIETDDAKQELSIYLLRVYKSYDRDIAQFSTFAVTALKRRAITIVQSEYRANKRLFLEARTLFEDEQIPSDFDLTEIVDNKLDRLQDLEREKKYIRKIRYRLTKKELKHGRAVFDGVLEGKSISVIARERKKPVSFIAGVVLQQQVKKVVQKVVPEMAPFSSYGTKYQTCLYN